MKFSYLSCVIPDPWIPYFLIWSKQWYAVKSINCRALCNLIFFILFVLHLLYLYWVQIIFSIPCSQTVSICVFLSGKGPSFQPIQNKYNRIHNNTTYFNHYVSPRMLWNFITTNSKAESSDIFLQQTQFFFS
jgi:hypothetical protein